LEYIIVATTTVVLPVAQWRSGISNEIGGRALVQEQEEGSKK
jgi:hypothetical protein